MATALTQDTVLNMVQSVYWRAFKENRLDIALKAAMLLGQTIGMFGKNLEKPGTKPLPALVPFSEMSQAQLEDFMDALAEIDPELKAIRDEDKEDERKLMAYGNPCHPRGASP